MTRDTIWVIGVREKATTARPGWVSKLATRSFHIASLLRDERVDLHVAKAFLIAKGIARIDLAGGHATPLRSC